MSMRSIAFRSDCNNHRAKLVFVVTKNARALLITFSGRAFRAGCVIPVVEAQFSFRPCTVRLKSCVDTKLDKELLPCRPHITPFANEFGLFLVHSARPLQSCGSGRPTLGHPVYPRPAVGAEAPRGEGSLGLTVLAASYTRNDFGLSCGGSTVALCIRARLLVGP
jgi:hypothetical protein